MSRWIDGQRATFGNEIFVRARVDAALKHISSQKPPKIEVSVDLHDVATPLNKDTTILRDAMFLGAVNGTAQRNLNMADIWREFSLAAITHGYKHSEQPDKNIKGKWVCTLEM